MRLALVALVALAGCSKYARTSIHDAPGNVPDLALPLPNENGAPDRYQPPEDPGTETFAVVAQPSFTGGYSQRADDGIFDFGLGVRFEYHDGVRNWLGPTLAGTIGVSLVDIANRPGGTGVLARAELNLRLAPKGFLMLDFGAGPAMYLDTKDVGAQLSLRFMVFTVRARYMRDAGVEIVGGYEMPIPFLFRRSK